MPLNPFHKDPTRITGEDTSALVEQLFRGDNEVAVRADARVDIVAQAILTSAARVLQSLGNITLHFRGHSPLTVGPSDGGTLYWPVLISLSSRVYHEDADITTELRSVASEAISRNGRSGRGTALVFQDPNQPVPPRFGSPLAFPDLHDFRRVVQTMDKESGGSQVAGSDHALSQFLYEVASNAFEHGRFNPEDVLHCLPYGIALQKVRGKHADELRSQPLLCLPAVAKWFENTVPRMGTKPTLSAFLVADPGQGIHHTLPQSCGVDAWSRLSAGFRPGTTRKGPGPLGAGEGLSTAWRSARDEGAFLGVVSGATAGYADFSSGSDSTNYQLHPWHDLTLHEDSGTAIFLILPELVRSGRQQVLFTDVERVPE